MTEKNVETELVIDLGNIEEMARKHPDLEVKPVVDFGPIRSIRDVADVSEKDDASD